jgi:hypothetical protein
MRLLTVGAFMEDLRSANSTDDSINPTFNIVLAAAWSVLGNTNTHDEIQA